MIVFLRMGMSCCGSDSNLCTSSCAVATHAFRQILGAGVW